MGSGIIVSGRGPGVEGAGDHSGGVCGFFQSRYICNIPGSEGPTNNNHIRERRAARYTIRFELLGFSS